MLTGKRRKALLEEAKRQMYSNGSLKHQVDERPVDDLQQLYLELNDELFNSDLPEDLPVIYSFNLNNRRTKSTCYGKCYYSSQGISKRGHRKKCKAVKIEIKPGMTPSQTRKTLVHEMCHAFRTRHGFTGTQRERQALHEKAPHEETHAGPCDGLPWSKLSDCFLSVLQRAVPLLGAKGFPASQASPHAESHG